MDHIDPGNALCDASTRCWRYKVCSKWNQRQHKTFGGIILRMFELHTPGGDLQIQTLEVIGLYSKQKEVWGAPTMERAI